jgi:transposase
MAMMGDRQIDQAALFYEFSIERHVPADHMLRAIDRFVDLEGVRARVAPFYSPIGRPSIDPELLIRMLIVGYCFGIRSERRLCEEVHLNLAYRWFCRLGLDGDVPDHSTFSKNRHGRFRDCDLLRHLFETVVERCMTGGRGGGVGVRPPRQPDQGRRQPPAVRPRRWRSSARSGEPGHRRVPGGAGRRGLRRRDPGCSQVPLTGRSGGQVDRRGQGAGLLRLLHQLSDRSRSRGDRR